MSKLEQFSLDAFRAPQEVGRSRLPDEGDGLRTEGRVMHLGRSMELPAPVPAQEGAMPAEVRVRQDDEQGLTPAPDLAAQHRQQRARSG